MHSRVDPTGGAGYRPGLLRTRSRAALATLVLAVLGSTALAVTEVVGWTSEAEERVSTPLWLAGWVLLVWASVLGVGTLVRLLRAGRGTDAAFTVLVLVGVVVVAALHPLAGSGGGTG